MYMVYNSTKKIFFSFCEPYILTFHSLTPLVRLISLEVGCETQTICWIKIQMAFTDLSCVKEVMEFSGNKSKDHDARDI